MTALDEIRATRLLTDVREKLTAWEKELVALPEGIGTAVAEVLEANAQRQQAHVRALQQEQTAWRAVQERHVTTLSTATDLLDRLITINQGLTLRTRRALYRLVLVFGVGVLVGAAIMWGAFAYAMRSTPTPAPPDDTRTAAPAHHTPRHPGSAAPWRIV